ncbi:MAG TPA: hypothetical protein PK231_02995, partial [Acidocella sp.]|nr:hypothetical protein [Acidocella sp.]
MSVLTAFDVAAMFAVKGGEMVLAVHEGLEKAAQVVETRAKDIIGHYQQESGPFDAWRELADSTKADRVQQGYSENEPLLRSGDMRESIEHSTDGSKAVVGSDDDKALWMEMG